MIAVVSKRPEGPYQEFEETVRFFLTLGPGFAAIPGSVLLGQFQNPANPAIYQRTTVPEILAAVGRELAAFEATASTGGPPGNHRGGTRPNGL